MTHIMSNMTHIMSNLEIKLYTRKECEMENYFSCFQKKNSIVGTQKNRHTFHYIQKRNMSKIDCLSKHFILECV